VGQFLSGVIGQLYTGGDNYFDNILFVLSETEIEKDIFDGCITADNLEDFFDKIKQIQL